MFIQKGPLSAVWWWVMECSLARRAVFSMRDGGTNVFNFLKLKEEEPDIGEAVAQALLSERFDDVWVYRMTMGKPRSLVIASDQRNRELVYPISINFEIENEFLLGANQKAQRNLLSFIWMEEGGWIFLLLYPILANITVLFGWVLLEVAPTAYMPNASRCLAWIIMLLGVAIEACPVAWMYIRRSRIRNALTAISREELERTNRMFSSA